MNGVPQPADAPSVAQYLRERAGSAAGAAQPGCASFAAERSSSSFKASIAVPPSAFSTWARALRQSGRALSSSRRPLSAIPLPALIAVHGLRVLGVSFLLLHSMQRLPAPFAPVAGWGDIFVGATAGPVAWMAARAGGRARGLVLAWNAVGLLDLVAAVGLGATSSPGPLRLFMEPPGSPIMTTLPWIVIPCFLVPSLAALHIAIFRRLSRAASGVIRSAPAAKAER